MTRRIRSLDHLRLRHGSRAAWCARNPGDRSQNESLFQIMAKEIRPASKSDLAGKSHQALAKPLAAPWQFATCATALSAASPPRPH